MVARWYPRGRTVPSKRKPWYERGCGRRFQRDDAIVRTYYPGLAWRIDRESELARLDGTITIVELGGISTPVSTRVNFPQDYPASEPVGLETGGRFVRDQDHHFIPATGQCCLWLPPLSKWDPGNPDALHPFLDELTVFFDRQLVFEATGRWPGPSWDHGVEGYWGFIVEQLGSEAAADSFLVGITTTRNDTCPCGSQRRFKRCHLPRFDTLRHKIIPSELARLLEWRTKQRAVSRPEKLECR